MNVDKSQMELVCARSEVELVKLENQSLMYSNDGGESWQPVPWKAGLKIRFFAAMGNFAWPPAIDCFGWRRGKISAAWHSNFEEELNIGKYVGAFDPASGRWSMEILGQFDLADGVIRTWFEDAEFEVFERTFC